MKSGFVTIAGRPNTGKSTLLNSILERKIAITSNVSGTTRNIIEGIYNDDDSQIVFVDTPGIHKPVNKLGSYMNNKAYEMLNSVDVILFTMDVTKPFGKGDSLVLDKIKEENKPVFLILNKVDLIDKNKLFEIIAKYNELYDFKEIFPISALKGDNVDKLIESIKKYLNDGDRYFPEDDVTNVSLKFQIGELVREKLLWLTKEEVPHTVTCYTETYEDMGKYIDIGVVVVVDRENLKKIIIGKNGSMLKKVGIYARKDIEELVGKQVNLKTYVKVIESWREKEKFLRELGFDEINE
jgi:GTP-binding protein Era